LFSASGTVVEGGYCNTVTASGAGVGSAFDSACYTGVIVPPPDIRISITKAINAVDPWAPTEAELANDRPVVLEVGQEVVYSYLVTNTGSVRVWLDKALGLHDDNATRADPTDDFYAIYVDGDLNGDGWLDPGETWLFVSVAMAAREGLWTNEATVTVHDPDTDTVVTATATAAYRGLPPGTTGNEGLTPGFWKTNAEQRDAVAWPRTAEGGLLFDPTQTVVTLFANVPTVYADLTLVEALDLGGGGVEALLRHAVAAALNAAHPDVYYPLTLRQVIELVDEALASGDPRMVEQLKDRLEGYNELGARLDANGEVSPPPGPSSSTAAAIEGDVASDELAVDAMMTTASTGSDAPSEQLTASATTTVASPTVEGLATDGTALAASPADEELATSSTTGLVPPTTGETQTAAPAAEATSTDPAHPSAGGVGAEETDIRTDAAAADDDGAPVSTATPTTPRGRRHD
jgi:hypothetical protein